jgi:hypothetical protein
MSYDRDNDNYVGLSDRPLILQLTEYRAVAVPAVVLARTTPMAALAGLAVLTT